MFGLYPKVFYGARKGQKNIFKPALPACIWGSVQAFDLFHRRAVCDWNRKELVPFISAPNCKPCPVMTGTRRHRGCLLWVWLDFEKQLWAPDMGIAKCFPSSLAGGLQEPVPVGPWAAGQGWLCRALRNLSVQAVSVCLHRAASCREHIFPVLFNKLLEISVLLVSW